MLWSELGYLLIGFGLGCLVSCVWLWPYVRAAIRQK